MKKYLLLLVALGCLLPLLAQKIDLQKKQLKALRINTPLKIDGDLSEIDWQQAPFATDMVVNQPAPGSKPSQRSEIKVLYDDSAIYVGAMLYDTHPDSILREVTQRDNIGNSDWFGIFLDPYQDGINGVSFIVSGSGAQFDAKYSVFEVGC